MSQLAITFFFALALSFLILIVFLRPEPASKAARRRLLTIQNSVRIQDAGAYGDDLGAAESRNLSSRLGVFLERYRFSAQLKALLVHSGSTMSVGGAVLASVGSGAGAGLICFFILHLLLLAAAAALAGGAIPYGLLRFKRGRRLKKFNAAA